MSPSPFAMAPAIASPTFKASLLAENERLEETITSLYQQIGTAEARAQRMEIHRKDVVQRALDLARRIDDEYVKAHPARAQLISAIQVMLRDELQLMLTGEKQA